MRFTIIDNFPFIEYFQRLIHILTLNPDDESFNQVCNNGHKEEYLGSRPC